MKKNPLVSIIVVNWNGGQIVKDCIDSLNRITYSNLELLFVDNGSSDGSERYAKRATKATRVVRIKNNDNKGFAEANNQGYKKSKGEYILLLNNDTKVTNDFLNKLVSFLEDNSEVGVVQPKLEMMDKKGYLDNAGSFMTWTGFLEHWGFNKKDSREFSKPREVYSAKGACMLIRRSIIDQIGLFDSSFGSYFEESDFCMRVWISGWKVMFYPDSLIYHKVGFTSERLQTIEVNYHSIKNRVASLYKNLQFPYLHVILFNHTVICIGLTAYYVLRFQFNKAGMFVRGYWWNITHIAELSRKRVLVQENRVVTDREIFRTNMHTFDLQKMIKHFLHVEKSITTHTSKSYPDQIPLTGRVRVCLDLVKKVGVKNKTVVNVGCSFGWMERELNTLLPRKVIGIDPNESAISFAQANVKDVDFLVGSANKIPVPDRSADVITLFDVIEHVPANSEPEVFAEIYRVLKPGGTLLLSTPNDYLLTNLLDPAWYFGHRHYKEKSLVRMISNSGFDSVSVMKKGTVWFSIFLLWLYTMKWIVRIKSPRFNYLEKKDDQGFKDAGYHTLFVTAVKPSKS